MARAIRNAIDSRESFAVEPPIFIARQADLRESLEFPIRANHATKVYGHTRRKEQEKQKGAR